MTIPEEFDPYSQWLGIDAREQPVDHYRLLGLPRFTSDVGTIALAADRQMALIRSYQTGPRGRFTQPVLNDIAAAKLCLLNPSAKLVYDAMLQGLAAATEPPPVASSPAPPPPTLNSNSSSPADVDTTPLAEHGLVEEWTEANSRRSSFGSIVLALSLAVIVVVITTVSWQVIAKRSRAEATAREAAEGSGAVATDAGTENTSPTEEAVVVYQEADGSVNFAPSAALVTGESIHLESFGITDVLSWTSIDDRASWKCKVVKLPPNGVFRVLVTYRASTSADDGTFEIAINDRKKTCPVRGTGEFVTDEHFLALTRSGEQTLEIRSLDLPADQFELRSIRFAMPTVDE